MEKYLKSSQIVRPIIYIAATSAITIKSLFL